MNNGIEIDSDLLAWAVAFGLAEYRDGCWQATDEGNRILREYLADLALEAEDGT